jgi:hypothetical protein
MMMTRDFGSPPVWAPIIQRDPDRGLDPLGGFPECSSMWNDQTLEKLQQLSSLKQVLSWSLDRNPRAEFVDVVVQDEYHHDVVVRIADRVFAVFESS